MLTSGDGGNFEEAAAWHKNTRPEPSFEETFMFASSVEAKAVTLLMRGPKPWGYFGISNIAALSGPYSFMLVSGKAGAQEQCMVSGRRSVGLQPCMDAIVAGSGLEIFSFTEGSQLQSSEGKCVSVIGSHMSKEECEGGQSTWEATRMGS